jgi:outer membrane protein OmpA-like peptidoglycan-associated protein
MRMFGIFVVWLLTFAVGGAGAWAYKEYIVGQGYIVGPRRTVQSRIDEFEEKWAEAQEGLERSTPPDLEKIVEAAPFGQRHELRQKLAEIDKKRKSEFEAKVSDRYDELGRQFESEFHTALEFLEDTPTVDAFLTRLHVDDHHKDKLRPRLVSKEESLQKRNLRTDLRIDAFSGYFVLRSAKFRTRLKELLDAQGLSAMKLHLADDGAKYEKRMKAVEKGEAPLAVFTLDSLINNSEAYPSPPAAAFLVIDETRGADAIVAYPDVYASPEDLSKHSDLRMVLTSDSPSEMLGRLVRDKYKLPENCFIKVDTPEEVRDRFFKAKPSDHSVFVLWEPFISKVINEKPKAHKLISSEKFPGSIVDVLTVQKKYLKDHPAEVKAIAQAYLEASAAYRGSVEKTVAAVLEDSKKQVAAGTLHEPLSEEEAKKVVRGIAWKTTADNYTHFGLNANPSPPLPSVTEMVANIGKVLRDTGAISRQVQPEAFFDSQTMKALADAKFAPDTPGDIWTDLRPVVGSVSKDVIRFRAGSANISGTAEEQLQEVVKMMKMNPGYYLEVRGASGGNTEADKEVAMARAKAVVKWLESSGVEAQRLKAVTVEKPTEEQLGVTFSPLEPPR